MLMIHGNYALWTMHAALAGIWNGFHFFFHDLLMDVWNES